MLSKIRGLRRNIFLITKPRQVQFSTEPYGQTKLILTLHIEPFIYDTSVLFINSYQKQMKLDIKGHFKHTG